MNIFECWSIDIHNLLFRFSHIQILSYIIFLITSLSIIDLFISSSLVIIRNITCIRKYVLLPKNEKGDAFMSFEICDIHRIYRCNYQHNAIRYRHRVLIVRLTEKLFRKTFIKRYHLPYLSIYFHFPWAFYFYLPLLSVLFSFST